jgi:hypothetical protein
VTDPASAALTVAADCADAFRAALGDRLIGAYVLGSLAHGGYSPSVSDIDLALVLGDGADPAVIRSTWDTLRERGGRYRKVSAFWSSLAALRRGEADGRFPALDRLDLAEHGRILSGSDVLGEVAKPGADELALDSARFAVAMLAGDEVLAEFDDPERLLADPVRFTKAVLFPVRFRYSGTMTVGRAARNDEAIAWYLALPDPPGADLVRLAASVRAGTPVDPETAAPLVLAGLRPLYLGYVDEMIPRLSAMGAPAELVDAFTDWRQRLAR